PGAAQADRWHRCLTWTPGCGRAATSSPMTSTPSWRTSWTRCAQRICRRSSPSATPSGRYGSPPPTTRQKGTPVPVVTTSAGVRLYAEAPGPALPVLSIHEFAADHRTWSRQVEALGGTFRCITYASRGYPPSEVPPEQERYNYLRQADDAI